MSGLEEKQWRYSAEVWVENLLNWVEFLRRTGHPSTTSLRNIVVHIPVTGLSDQDAEKAQQLFDLLLERVPSRCPVETIQSFELVLVRKFDTRVGLLHSYYGAEFDSIIQHCCRFCENLPLNITKFRFNRRGLRSEARDITDPILSALSENRHLTELEIDLFSSVLTDQLIPRNPLLETLTLYEPLPTSENDSILMRSVFNGKSSRLRTFTYSHCQYNDDNDDNDTPELDVEAMALLKVNTHLEHLTFENIYVGDAGAFLIADVLTVNKSLKILEMMYCGIGDHGCMALCKALQVNNTLQSLDLTGNNLGDECAHSFVSALRINRTLRTFGTDNSFLAGMLLKSDITLQRMHGVYCDDAEEASFIAEGLKVNKSLMSLQINPGGISDQGCIALAQALQVNLTLEKLILDPNQIRDAGIQALVSALHINRTLRHLSICGNLFGDAGVSFIAEALKVSKTLKSLEMYWCDIGDQGCQALAQALQVNNTLERLALNSFKLGEAGVRAFIPTLRINRTLQHLEIKGMELPAKETAEELLQVVCHFLLSVRIGSTEVEEDDTPTASLLMRLHRATFFNSDFDEKCRELKGGTISDSHASFRWFLPLLGATHPLVKKTVLFLLLRQRAEIAARSLQLLLGKASTLLQAQEE